MAGRSVSLTVEVATGLAASWPGLVGDGPLFATTGWLRAMAGRLGPEPLTFVVRRDGRAELAAFASVQRRHRPGELFDLHHVLVEPSQVLPLTEPARQARSGLSRLAPAPQRWTPFLLCMLPGYECAVVGSGDPAALRVLVDGTVDWAREHGIATVAMLYVRPAATALAAALAERGFTAVPLTPTWDLRLPGTSFADYLAGLPRKRRKEAGRELRRLEVAGVRIEPVDVEAVFEHLVRLRCNLVARYRDGRDPHAERVKLRHIVDDVAGGHPHVLLATAGDDPVGFALFAAHRDEWHCLATGSEYADARSRLTYFATAYYRAAEHGYRHGVRTIGYGLGAWEAKRARGCRPTPLTGWIHTTDPQLSDTVRTSARLTRLLPL